MTVDAIFKTNDGVETQLKDDLETQLHRTLDFLFWPSHPDHHTSMELILQEVQQQLLQINCEARRISFVIQHNIVTCAMAITLAPDSDTDLLGTQSFGLQTIVGPTRHVLLQYKALSLHSLSL